MVFDEPTTGLDVMTSQTIMSFIEQCRSDGLTVVFSTYHERGRATLRPTGYRPPRQDRRQGTVSELQSQTQELAMEKFF